jgi:XTP/dITP diphosphohydrolase
MRRLPGRKLVLATHNPDKLAEARAMLAPLEIAVLSAAELGLAPPEETEDSFAGNAWLKADAAARATGMPALADDSGVAIEALGGAPGIRTADWAETPSGRDFGIAMKRAHDALIASAAAEPWRACFVCALALVWADGRAAAVEGRVDGRIVWPPRGNAGHGYDPVFQPDGFAKTFAEMPAQEKNRISHRAQAFAALREGPLGP